MAKVAIFGTEGMLGRELVQVIGQEHEVVEFNRSGNRSKRSSRVVKFDANDFNAKELIYQLKDVNYIFNSIAMVKQKIPLNPNSQTLSGIIQVNALFPLSLEKNVSESAKIIEIGTDCVFSGSRGGYLESDLKDPTDVYGWSKALGESNSERVMRLRTSIIGCHPAQKSSLLDWFLGRELNSKVTGYSNHFWNGMTTLQFSKIVLGVINQGVFEAGTFHLSAEDTISKGELLKVASAKFNRLDLQIDLKPNSIAIDRSLKTLYPDVNVRLWKSAGYERVPTINEMLEEFVQASEIERVIS